MPMLPPKVLSNPQKRRAPQPPKIESSESSLVNIDPQQIKNDASSAASKAESTADDAADKAGEKGETLKQKADETASTTKEKSSEMADSAKKNFEKGKGKAKDGANAAEKEIKGEYNEVYENRDNPVVIGNAVAITAGVIGLGYGAYTKHVKGELDWQIAGIAAAAVGVFAVGDYYLSQ
ncbi:uncharacterized protein KY384_008717 [Bacidia gigantensis]|uniref:uncharacterized protein n=1 Tax=Bacidia gigantensis TaxID=2732470 RepID=UPI001D0368F1|nr:uncharacterized protein KY384_008717 [Bacidia gigantensis]KAG8526517.1 hypothetical protein KY384_008717 [Bacidia gigantensis]